MRLRPVRCARAGKGNQAEFIADHFGIPKISTGDIFRTNVWGGTELGLLAKKYMDAGRPGPRRGHQRDGARPARRAGRRQRVSCSTASRERLAGRRARRRSWPDIGASLASCSTSRSTTTRWCCGCPAAAPARSAARAARQQHRGRCGRVDDVCERCGGQLYQRDDDRAETVRHRLEVYTQQTEPLVAFYTSRQQLQSIDALGPVREVTEPRHRGARRRCAAASDADRSASAAVGRVLRSGPRATPHP